MVAVKAFKPLERFQILVRIYVSPTNVAVKFKNLKQRLIFVMSVQQLCAAGGRLIDSYK